MLTLILMGVSFVAGVAVGVQLASTPLIGALLGATAAAGAVAARPRRRSSDLLRTTGYADDLVERGDMARRVRERRTHRRRHP
jgi:hypothetical protein